LTDLAAQHSLRRTGAVAEEAGIASCRPVRRTRRLLDSALEGMPAMGSLEVRLGRMPGYPWSVVVQRLAPDDDIWAA
jgi:hypothetical protein